MAKHRADSTPVAPGADVPVDGIPDAELETADDEGKPPFSPDEPHVPATRAEVMGDVPRRPQDAGWKLLAREDWHKPLWLDFPCRLELGAAGITTIEQVIGCGDLTSIPGIEHVDVDWIRKEAGWV